MMMNAQQFAFACHGHNNEAVPFKITHFHCHKSGERVG